MQRHGGESAAVSIQTLKAVSAFVIFDHQDFCTMGKNPRWTVLEDKLLVQVWLYLSQKPGIVMGGLRAETFWALVTKMYHANLPDSGFSVRSSRGLSGRWREHIQPVWT